MVPPVRHGSMQPDGEVDEDTTGITSLTTRALLEGLCFDMRALRGDQAEMRGALVAIEVSVKDVVDRSLRSHVADEAVWHRQMEAELGRVRDELARISPLTQAHEQLLQQAKGAAAATKVIYALIGVLTSGSAIAFIQWLLHR